MMINDRYDYLIIGGGIVGLTIAATLKNKKPGSRICVLEKENKVGLHASGRNSGVLHSGIYYPEGSLKGRLCMLGAKKMASYCDENNLPINRLGKVIVPTEYKDDAQIDLLYERALKNGAKVSIIDAKQLSEIEPEASTTTGRALYSPETAIVDSMAILESLSSRLKMEGVILKYLSEVKSADPDEETVTTCLGETFSYGMLINCAGQFSDRISSLFQVGQNYKILPFRGSYFRLSKHSDIHINGLIYPLPNLDLPFLGVHSVKNISNEVYFGPTAIPALGRENYFGFSGANVKDAAFVSYQCLKMYMKNEKGFRQYTHEESLRFLKKNFVKAAKKLTPNLKDEHLLSSKKVGIRAQLVDINKNQLEMDFIVEKKGNTVHVLNSVSPAFTSSFAMADYIFENFVN